MFDAGLITTTYHTVKIIARGEYAGKATVRVQAASASVKVLLAKNGGSFEAVATPNLPSSNKERAAKKADKAEKTAKKTEK